MGSCNGVFHAVDTATGKARWTYEALADARPGGRAEFHGNPLVAGDLVIAGSDDRDPGGRGFLYAWDRRTGRVRWKREVGRGAMADVVRRGSRLYAVTLSDELLCLDLASGRTRWTHAGAGGPDPSQSVSFLTTPLLADGRIYRGTQDGAVHALDAESGRVVWSRPLGATVIGPVTAAAGALYVATEDHSLVRLRRKDGAVLARARLGSRASGPAVPVAGAVFLFVVDTKALEDDVVLALRSYDAGLIEERWTRGTPGGWTSSRPYVWRGEVLVGGRRGLVAGLRPADGSVSWSDTLAGTIRGIAAGDGRLYVGTLGGTLYAYEPPAR